MSLDKQRRIILSNIPPGKYWLRINGQDNTESNEAIFHTAELIINQEKNTFKIPLGAGSLSGKLNTSTNANIQDTLVIASGKSSSRTRKIRCDKNGNFIFRYLPEDDYVLYAHDDKTGCAKLGKYSVKNNTADIGQHKLAPGCNITGTVNYPNEKQHYRTISAEHSSGISISANIFKGTNGEEYRIPNLWPGKWKITLSQNFDIVVEKNIEIKGTETIKVDLNQTADK